MENIIEILDQLNKMLLLSLSLMINVKKIYSFLTKKLKFPPKIF